MRIAIGHGQLAPTLIQEPADQFYGERQYRARDPEGHVWTFSQPIRPVSREETERLSGLHIEGWHRATVGITPDRPAFGVQAAA